MSLLFKYLSLTLTNRLCKYAVGQDLKDFIRALNADTPYLKNASLLRTQTWGETNFNIKTALDILH